MKVVILLNFIFILTQHQYYTTDSGKVISGVILNRGSSTTYDGCMSQAKSWVQAFRGYNTYEFLDGYGADRKVAIGREVVELKCERKNTDGMGKR